MKSSNNCRAQSQLNFNSSSAATQLNLNSTSKQTTELGTTQLKLVYLILITKISNCLIFGAVDLAVFPSMQCFTSKSEQSQ